MMIRHLSATGTLLVLTLLPLTAQAYVTPEEELNDSNYSTRFYEPPPSTRSVDDRQAQQQRVSAERRDAELNAVKPQPETEPEPMHKAAPAEEQSDLDKMIELIKLLQTEQSSEQSSDASTSMDDPITQRLLLRVQAQQATAERAAFIRSIGGENGETLHSGAPLADTGPATALTILAIAGAIGETWRRVRKNEKLPFEALRPSGPNGKIEN